jgi:hypothetical protein
MGTKTAANTGNVNGKKKHPGRPQNLKPWPKGVSGNPKGAPKRGQSWSEIITEYGELTPSQAAEKSLALAKQFLSIGDGVTLKQAVIMRVYASLLFEPTPGLFNAFMERTEGKVADKLILDDWRKDATAAGLDPDSLAAELFARVAPKVSE